MDAFFMLWLFATHTCDLCHAPSTVASARCAAGIMGMITSTCAAGIYQLQHSSVVRCKAGISRNQCHTRFNKQMARQTEPHCYKSRAFTEQPFFFPCSTFYISHTLQTHVLHAFSSLIIDATDPTIEERRKRIMPFILLDLKCKQVYLQS